MTENMLKVVVPISEYDVGLFKKLKDKLVWTLPTNTDEEIELHFISDKQYISETKNTIKKLDPIKEMMLYQSERGLDKLEYNPLNEASMVFEEILESLGYNLDKSKRNVLKDRLEEFVEELYFDCITTKLDKSEYTGHNVVDPHLDQIELNVGAIMKLGYDVNKSILEMTKEIRSRKGEIINGKFEKFTKDDPRYAEPYKADYSKTKLKE